MDTDDANDLGFLAITPVPSESILHSLEQAARSIGLYVNSDKTDNVFEIKWSHLQIKCQT